jgi:hypothetical protein
MSFRETSFRGEVVRGNAVVPKNGFLASRETGFDKLSQFLEFFKPFGHTAMRLRSQRLLHLQGDADHSG